MEVELTRVAGFIETDFHP